MRTKHLFYTILLCLFGVSSLDVSAKTKLAPAPFEYNGIYYAIMDTETTDVYVSQPNVLPSGWYSYYSGIVNIPASIPYEGKPYTVKGIRDNAFGGQKNITTVIFPKTVETIGKQAFGGCSGLTSVVFSSTGNLKSIGKQSFNSCTALKSITFPNSLTYIGEEAFNDCSSLKSIKGGSSIENIDNQAFQGLTSLTDVTLTAKRIGVHAFWNCNNLRTVTLNEGVEELDEGAFMQCSSLQEVNLPNTLKKIGNEAFRLCLGLQSIVIPNSVNELGVGVFRLCTGLQSVQLSNSLKEIPGYTFQQTALKSIEIPNSVTSIGVAAFNDCKQLQTVKWSNSITIIWDQAFMGDDSLIISTLPESMSEIGGYAFKDCSRIQEITIPSATIQIGDGAFENCRSLKNVYNLSMTPQNTPYTNPAFKQCDCPVIVHVFKGLKSVFETSVGWAYQIDNGFITIIDDIPVLKIQSITIDNAPYHCEVGAVGQATATILPANVANRELSWSSSDPDILYIEEFTGQFVGFADGVVTITAAATDGSGVSASAKVYVGTEEINTRLKGDVNEDEKVDISDIVAVINQIAGTAKYRYADVNDDSKVDISDIVAIINIIATGNTSVNTEPEDKPYEVLKGNINLGKMTECVGSYYYFTKSQLGNYYLSIFAADYDWEKQEFLKPGYMMVIDLFTEDSNSPDFSKLNAVFKVAQTGRYEEWTFQPGTVTESHGEPAWSGTYVDEISEQVDSQTGEKYLGYGKSAMITGGTIKATSNGETVTFVLDLVTEAGGKVTGTYTGNPDVRIPDYNEIDYVRARKARVSNMRKLRTEQFRRPVSE